MNCRWRHVIGAILKMLQNILEYLIFLKTVIKNGLSLNKSKPQNIAFIIMNDNEPIGVAYFHSIDYIKKKADWGMYIYKENFRGKGVGFFVLTECIDFAKNNLKLFTLYLDVLKSNIAAIKLYQKCGFKEMWADDLFYRYFLQLNEE